MNDRQSELRQEGFNRKCYNNHDSWCFLNVFDLVAIASVAPLGL